MTLSGSFDKLAWERNRYQKHKVLGLCGCGKERDEGRKTCSLCRERAVDYYTRNKSRCLATASRTCLKLRSQIYEAYGNKCACCGESEVLFMQVDHVNNDGEAHRKLRGESVVQIYRDVIKSGFSPDYQLLCANCNHGKMRNKGICPHQTRVG